MELDEMSALAYLIGSNPKPGEKDITIPLDLAVKIVLKLDKLRKIEKILNIEAKTPIKPITIANKGEFRCRKCNRLLSGSADYCEGCGWPIDWNLNEETD